MNQDSAQERNEEPTQLHREKARRKGQVAVSSDLTNSALLLAGLLVLKMTSSGMAMQLIATLQNGISSIDRASLTIEEVPVLFQAFLLIITSICLPLVIIGAVLGIAASLGQSGLLITTEPLEIDWSKLSPAKGFKKLFSIRSTVRSGMMVLRVAVATILVVWMVDSRLTDFALLGQGTLLETISSSWNMAMTIAIGLATTFFVVGVADYSFQRFQHERDLRMSKQEIRDEHKEHEGDVNVKARIRNLQRESAKQRMLKQVPTATVVLTNPTHYAVALRYERNSKGAPVVVAKGHDALARRIVKIAREHGVSVIEKKPLARALYAMVEVNQEIPPQLYRAIAEILAYIYGLRKSV
jgi:flagellar biosynthetic protein FlhB